MCLTFTFTVVMAQESTLSVDEVPDELERLLA